MFHKFMKAVTSVAVVSGKIAIAVAVSFWTIILIIVKAALK